MVSLKEKERYGIISDQELGKYFFNDDGLSITRGDLLESLYDDVLYDIRDQSDTRGKTHHSTYHPVRPLWENISPRAKDFLDALVSQTYEEIKKFHQVQSERLYRDSNNHLVGCRTQMIQSRPSRHIAIIDENLVAVSFLKCVWQAMEKNSNLQKLAQRHISDPLLHSICFPMPKDYATRMFLPIVLLHHMCTTPQYERLFMDLRVASSFLDLAPLYRTLPQHAKDRMKYTPGVTLAGIAARYGIALPNQRILSLPSKLFPRHTGLFRWEGLRGGSNLAIGPLSVASEYIHFLMSLDTEKQEEPLKNITPNKYDPIISRRAKKVVEAIVSGKYKQDRLARMLVNPVFVAMPAHSSLGLGIKPGEYPMYDQKEVSSPLVSLILTRAAIYYVRHLGNQAGSDNGLTPDTSSQCHFEKVLSRGIDSILQEIPQKHFGLRCLFAVSQRLWETRENWLSKSPRVKYLGIYDGSAEKTENIPLFLLAYNSSPVIPSMLSREEWDRYINFKNHIHRKLFINAKDNIWPSMEKEIYKTHFRKADYMMSEEDDGVGKSIAFLPNMSEKAPMEILADPDVFRFKSATFSNPAVYEWLLGWGAGRLVRSGRNIPPDGMAYIKEHGVHPFVKILSNLQEDPLVIDYASQRQIDQTFRSLAYLFRTVYEDHDITVTTTRGHEMCWGNSSRSPDPEDLGLILLSPLHRDLLLRPFLISRDSKITIRPVDIIGNMLDSQLFDSSKWGRGMGSSWTLLPACAILTSSQLWNVWNGPARKGRNDKQVSLSLGETAAEVFISFNMALSLGVKAEYITTREQAEETIKILRNKLASLQKPLAETLFSAPETLRKNILKRFYGTPRRKESMEICIPGLAETICVNQTVKNADPVDDLNIFDEPYSY